MNERPIIDYLLTQHVFSDLIQYTPIQGGASGAKLFLVVTSNGEYVLKVFSKSNPQNRNQYDNFKKELDFYQWNQHTNLSYIPKVHYQEEHKDFGLLLVMDKYQPITSDMWTLDLMKQAMDIGAQLHSIPLEKVTPLNLEFHPCEINWEDSKKAYEDWLVVLNSHPGEFDVTLLHNIYKNLDILCPILNREQKCLCHGDFHPENFLTDGSNLYLTDWQNVKIGKCIGDFSFFISRGQGMGIPMEFDSLLNYYYERLSHYLAQIPSKHSLMQEYHASTLLCTFSFWSLFLHDATSAQIAVHYNEMKDAYDYLVK